MKKVYAFEARIWQKVPLFLTAVRAGFPSPAEDYVDKQLDLNELLVLHPAATYMLRVEGDSMREAGIFERDLLVVDRSVRPGDGQVVVAVVDGEFTVKRFRKRGAKVWLEAANPAYPPLRLREGQNLEVWGVVVWVLHRV
jgi:DNA polymerase V